MSSIAPPSHTRTSKTTDDWITPKWLIDRLGPFDLDPCASDKQPWVTANLSFRRSDNGLAQPWLNSFVWMNPPYGTKTGVWLSRLATHNHGIALTFARTETKIFFRYVWPMAVAVLFIRGRLTFYMPDGTSPRIGHNSGGPSILIAYGETARERLFSCRDLGAFITLNQQSVARRTSSTTRELF